MRHMPFPSYMQVCDIYGIGLAIITCSSGSIMGHRPCHYFMQSWSLQCICDALVMSSSGAYEVYALPSSYVAFGVCRAYAMPSFCVALELAVHMSCYHCIQFGGLLVVGHALIICSIGAWGCICHALITCSSGA